MFIRRSETASPSTFGKINRSDIAFWERQGRIKTSWPLDSCAVVGNAEGPQKQGGNDNHSVYLAFRPLPGTSWPPLPRKLFADWPSLRVWKKPRWPPYHRWNPSTAALVEHPPNNSRPLCPQIWSTHIIPPSHAAGLACGTTSSQTAMIICDSNGWQRYLRSVPGIVYRRKMAAISALLGVSLPHEAWSNARLGWGGEWRPLCGVPDVRQREENKQGTRAKTRSMSVSSDLRVTTGDRQLLNLMHAQQCASM